MSNGPFVYHDMKIVTAKRRSKCKASLCVDFPAQGTIEAGEQCLEVTTAPSTIYSTRHARFCLKCAPGMVQHFMAPFEAINLKLKRLSKGLESIQKKVKQ